MRKSNFYLLFLGLSMTIFYSCSKNDDKSTGKTNDLPPTHSSILASLSSPVADSLVDDSLISIYNLVQIPSSSLPAGFQGLTVSSVQQGSTFFNNFIQQMSLVKTSPGNFKILTTKSSVTKNVIVNIPKGIANPLIELPLETNGQVIADFGNWSNVTISFSYSQNSDGTYSVSNVTTSVDGITLGIGYAQTSVVYYSYLGEVAFAVNGTVTGGLVVGPVIFGTQYAYYYNVLFSPNDPTGPNNSVTSGKGKK